MSVLSSMVYKAIDSVLSHEELESIDKIIDKIIDDDLVSTTKNMFGFPRKLLHISKDRGGHGLLSLRFDAESRKLQRLFSCLRSQLSQGLAAREILSWTARQHGYFSSTDQRIILIPFT